ncbi:hypothetical protein [Nocardia noduli]|uniref:hypothetical protein n=1 Tax=Nocardia noduli TaxID=2815722 RepID=UPI001C243C7D|nr:hypothetical protein [Nocardia noduli]
MSTNPRLRTHVETRYQDELPRDWSQARREEYLDGRVAEIRAGIEETTRMLLEHNVVQFSLDQHRSPSEQERIGLANNSRLQAEESALAELYDGYEFPEPIEPDGEPSQAEREALIGARMDAQWTALPSMQRWMTPWADDPDDDLIGLARRLWRSHDIQTKVAAAHLLHARRTANLPIPASPEDPLLAQIHQELLDGIAAEEQRQYQLRVANSRQS